VGGTGGEEGVQRPIIEGNVPERSTVPPMEGAAALRSTRGKEDRKGRVKMEV